jgi:hypothetical protein
MHTCIHTYIEMHTYIYIHIHRDLIDHQGRLCLHVGHCLTNMFQITTSGHGSICSCFSWSSQWIDLLLFLLVVMHVAYPFMNNVSIYAYVWDPVSQSLFPVKTMVVWASKAVRKTRKIDSKCPCCLQSELTQDEKEIKLWSLDESVSSAKASRPKYLDWKKSY